MSVRETAAHLIEGFDGRARAYVQVQNGCDHRCTLYHPVRAGNSRLSADGRRGRGGAPLVNNGYREVVLTGVDLTSYGADLPGTPKLGTLCRQVLKHVGGLRRLRLSSLDCIEIDAGLMDAFADEETTDAALASVAAGPATTSSSSDEATGICARMPLRSPGSCGARRPGIVFGADFIAGFPTETEDMFRVPST